MKSCNPCCMHSHMSFSAKILNYFTYSEVLVYISPDLFVCYDWIAIIQVFSYMLLSWFHVLRWFHFLISRSRFFMTSTRSKQKDLYTSSHTLRTKEGYDWIDYHQYSTAIDPVVSDDAPNLIHTRHSSYLRFVSPCLASQKERKASSESLSSHSDTIETTRFSQTIKSDLHETTNLLKGSPGIVYEEKCADAKRVKCVTATLSDLLTRDEIVRKLSILVAFYGNFVLIPVFKDTLEKTACTAKDVKLEYWPDVMAFIDSYDLSSTPATVKILIDELAHKISRFVERDGIVSGGWQKILCTLPDDTTTRMDYRLEKKIFEEVKSLAKDDQLPFDLSKPIEHLLASAEKRAGKYIRSD